MHPNPHSEGCPWHLAAEIFGAPDIKYCEETLCRIISEPANTCSNLGYILVGLFFLYKSRSSNNPWLRSLSLSVVVVGFTSLFYHLSNNFLTQFMDFLGMYSVLGLILNLGLYKVHWLKKHQVKWVYGLGAILFSAAVLGLRNANVAIQTSVIVIVLPAIVLEVITLRKACRQSLQRIVLSLFFFACAATSQMLDVSRVYCDPQNHFFQLHMMWHLFGALGFGGYLHYCYHLTNEDYERKIYEGLE